MSQAGARLPVDVDAQVWTLIGLLGAAVFGMLFYLGGRIDRLVEQVARLTERIGRLEMRFDDHVGRHTG
jgi:hypothetical protein